MNTQEMLEAVTPFNLTTTVKKVPLTILPDYESPTTTTYQHPGKNKQSKVRKRASFALPDAAASIGHNSGSSQGSIKASLKVSKGGSESTALAKPASKPEQSHDKTMDPNPTDRSESASASVSEFGKLGLDMETSASENEAEDRDNHPAMDAAASASEDLAILSRPPPTNTTTTSSKTPAQDAQAVDPAKPVAAAHTFDVISALAGTGTGGNISASIFTDATCHPPAPRTAIRAVPNEKSDNAEVGCRGDADALGCEDIDFDLSAAMDEVGSFLQSWDTDREVRSGEAAMHMSQKAVTRRSRKAALQGNSSAGLRSVPCASSPSLLLLR